MRRPPQRPTAFGDEPSVLLRLPMVPWVARHACPHGPFPITTINIRPQETHCLIFPCKCAVEAVVWMTAGATGAAQQVARGLPHLMPPAPREGGLRCPPDGAWPTEWKDTCKGGPRGRSQVTEKL